MKIEEVKALLNRIENREDPALVSLRQDERKGVQALIRQWEKRLTKREAERKQFENIQTFEKSLRLEGYQMIAGVDEVGRGPLAGPVTAACVILPEKPDLSGLTDSKKLSETKREFYAEKIRRVAFAVGTGEATSEEIDRLNIYEASKLAMNRAIAVVLREVEIDFLLVDAMTLAIDIPQKSLIKGDARSLSIAAASVIAKVERDNQMKELDRHYPQYGLASHMGYGTREHLAALDEYGPQPFHRKSFSPVRERDHNRN